GGGLLSVEHENADRFGSVAWRYNKAKRHVSHDNFVAIPDRHEVKLCRGATPEVHLTSRPGCQFVMPGNKVGMTVRLNDVLDRKTLGPGVFEINIGISLRIDH